MIAKVVQPGNATSVSSVTIGGAVATVAVWGLVTAGLMPAPPPEVMGAIVTVAIGLIGYFAR